MKTNHSKGDITALIDRFMTGDTTRDEEQMLGDYFRTARDIPEEWKTYKDMFSYFDDGMRTNRPLLRTAWPVRSFLTTAAVVLILFGLAIAGWQLLSGEEQSRLSCNADIQAVNSACVSPAGMKSCVMDSDKITAAAVQEKTVAKKSGGKIRTDKKETVRPNRPASEYSASNYITEVSSDKLTDMPPDMIYARETAECLAEMETIQREDNNDMIMHAYESMKHENTDCILVVDEDGYYKIVDKNTMIVL